MHVKRILVTAQFTIFGLNGLTRNKEGTITTNLANTSAKCNIDLINIYDNNIGFVYIKLVHHLPRIINALI